MRTYQKKKYSEALAYKLHRNWTSDQTMTRCNKIYTQGKIKIFYPEFKEWHRFLKMIACPKRFNGLFVNHQKVWIPHIALAAKLGISEIKAFNMLSELHDESDPDHQMGRIVETYSDRLPKSRRRAVWLDRDDLAVLDVIGCFKGQTWHKWQLVMDLVAEAEDYYSQKPWAQTKMGIMVHGNIDFKENAMNIFFIESRLMTKMPFAKLALVELSMQYNQNVICTNNVPFTEPYSKAIADVHLDKYYSKSKIKLFSGLAG